MVTINVSIATKADFQQMQRELSFDEKKPLSQDDLVQIMIKTMRKRK